MATETTPTIPVIGKHWPEHGGIYAGLARGEDGQPDGHLVLLPDEPPSRLDWAAAQQWAQYIEARLPTRSESALLYANVRDKIDASAWYWTGTQYSADYAWAQSFDNGNQYFNDEKCQARARAVRRFTA
jgi:hypothetical protein